jgi:hypothetical protein
MRTKYIWLVTIVVLAHLAVSLLHGRAHRELGVGLTSFQNVYVITVILLAPLVALILSWTRYARAGLLLLFVSMLGSLVFGFCYHYVIVSSDHVAHLPPGDARGAFRMTALLLLITEALGVIAALLALRKLSNRNHYA